MSENSSYTGSICFEAQSELWKSASIETPLTIKLKKRIRQLIIVTVLLCDFLSKILISRWLVVNRIILVKFYKKKKKIEVQYVSKLLEWTFDYKRCRYWIEIYRLIIITDHYLAMDIFLVLIHYQHTQNTIQTFIPFKRCNYGTLTFMHFTFYI